MLQSTRTIRASIIFAAAIAVVALAACGTTTPEASPTTEPTVADSPTVVEVTATATTEPTPAATATATQVPGVITKDNAADLVELRTIDASSTWISGLSFSKIDHTVATFGLGRNVDIWDADTGKRTIHLGTQADWGLGLAFSPDGKRLVSGASGGDMIVWDMDKDKKLASLVSPPSRIYDIEWRPDSDRFSVVGQFSSRVTIFDSSGTKMQEIKTPDGWLWATAWSQDFLAVSNDTTAKTYIYNAETFGNEGEVDAANPAGELDFSPDQSLLAGCFRVDGTLHFWKTSDWTEVNTWEAHPTKGIAQGCIGGEFSTDGKVYFTSGDDGNLIAWDVETGARLKTFEYGKMIWKISLSGDGKLLAAGLDDGQVKIIGLK